MIFHFHYNMPKVVKCGNSGPENVPVYLEDLRNSRIGLVQHHVTIIFGKIREGSLSWKKFRGCLSASVSQELTFNILYFTHPQCFPSSLQFAVLSAPLRVLWPTSTGKVSSKQCFMSRVQRMFCCEYTGWGIKISYILKRYKK